MSRKEVVHKKKASPGKKNNRDRFKPSALTGIEKAIILFLLAGLVLLLAVGPYERGLLFTSELLRAQVLLFSMLIIWGLFRFLRKDNRLIETPLDICLLILFIAYAASFFVAVDKRAALEEVMKIAAYLVVYLVVIDLCRYWFFVGKSGPLGEESANKDRPVPPGLNMILHLLVVVATVITLASILAPVIDWAYLGTYTDDRIGSPMGYANTAAAYMMTSYLLTLALAPLAARRLRVYYMAPAVLMLAGIILTFSRGAWLLQPPLALLLILVAAPGEKLRTFLYLLVTAAVGVPAAFVIESFYRSQAPEKVVLTIVITVALAMLLGFLSELYLRQNRRIRLVLVTAGAVCVLIFLIVAVVIPVFSPLSLGLEAGEPERRHSMKQVIGEIHPDEEYELRMEVNAITGPSWGSEEPDFIWGVRVWEGASGSLYRIRLDHKGGATDGWEEKSFSFKTGSDVTQLEVHFYHQAPGTSFRARSVTFVSAEEEQNLQFVLGKIFPEPFYDRLFSSTVDRIVDRRAELFQDAVKIVRDYPLLGTGGGGWAALYYGYQDQEYHSRAVHNHFLEVWIEAGIFGFLAFAGIWISFLVAFILNCLRRKVSPMVRQFWTALLLPVVALGLHSTIDWNFSLPAMGIFLFVLLGAGRSLDQVQWFNSKRKKETAKTGIQWLTGLAAMVIGILLLAYTIVLISGSRATVLSQELLERNIIKQATIEMEKAIVLDSFRAVNYHNLNVILEEQLQRTNNPDLIPDILFLAQRAYELEPYNPTYFLRYGELLIRYVNIEEGLSYIDRIIEVRPYFADSYREYALPRIGLAEFFINNDLPAEADKFLDEVFDIELLMQERIGRTEELYFFLGKAYFLREEYSKAFNYFMGVDENDRLYEQAQAHMEMIKEM